MVFLYEHSACASWVVRWERWIEELGLPIRAYRLRFEEAWLILLIYILHPGFFSSYGFDVFMNGYIATQHFSLCF